jgi:cellobiose phosphorylase
MVDSGVAIDNLLRALASQYPNGCVPHGFRPVNRLQYSDKPAWILMTVPGVLKETGDFSLLDKVVPYFESDEKGTVLDHCLRAMRFLAKDTGKNGLCDQHHADWNDGLEATAESGDRESVMVTQQLCYGLLEMIEIAKRIKRPDIEKEAKDYFDTFKKRLNEVAWDGEWYVRTICGDGYRIGSKDNKEGKIFLNTQSWAILSQTASEDRAKLAFAAVDKFIKEDVGYRICKPGFSERDPRVGRMSEGIPDHIENGGCYNHAAGFKGVADCMMKRAEEAWLTFVKVAPGNPLNPISISQVEPFSFTNSYTMYKRIHGRSGYPWRTGTAAWFTILLIEWILGARRHYDGLLIDPCLSKELRNVGIVRVFRGTRYEIEIDNTAGRCVGAQSITVDGEKLSGNLIKPAGKKVCKVKVIV